MTFSPAKRANPTVKDSSKAAKKIRSTRSTTVVENDTSTSFRNKDGTFKSQWIVGNIVNFLTDDNEWVEAKITAVSEAAVDLNPMKGDKLKVSVEWTDKDGHERTADIFNQDFTKKLRRIDPIEVALGNTPEKLIYMHLSKLLSSNQRDQITEEYEKTKHFSFDMMFKSGKTGDGKSFGALQTIADIVLENEEAVETIDEVKKDYPDSENNILLSLGYLAGSMVGLELQYELVKGRINRFAHSKCVCFYDISTGCFLK